MHSFKALPMKRSDIRQLTADLRKTFGQNDRLWFPILEFVELTVPSIDANYSFEVAEAAELGSSHGLTVREGEHVTVKIRADVYDGAYVHNGRDRGTVAHELGHYILHAKCPVLHRHFGGEIESYEDPEWQAKCFHGELMVPRHMVKGMSAIDVANQCGVSLDCANYQLRLYASGK